MKECFAVWLDVVFPRAGSAAIKPPDRIVTTGRLAKDAALAIEIATSLHDAEVQRRQGADTKAALYLAFLPAVLPLVGVLTPTVSDRFRGPVLALDVALFAIALVYILMAGWYAARATVPGVVHAIGEDDLSDALGDADARATMASRLIDATRRNYPLNNRKIDYVRLTQAHIFRAFILILLIVAIDWGTDTMTAIGRGTSEQNSFSAEGVCSPFGLPQSGSGGSAGGGLSYHLSESGTDPVCLPSSIAVNRIDHSTASP